MMPATAVPRTADGHSLERTHLVGVGGAGMSAIARILADRGLPVSGSDAKGSHVLTGLTQRGVRTVLGHRADNLDLLDGGPTAVVVSTAIRADNAEVAEARRRGIPVVLRAQALAALMDGSRSVCVAGTHGKTSTTSMLTVALQRAGLDPSFAIGGELNESGSGAHQGTGDVFVAEADESDGSFLAFTPHGAIITNLEPDHLDHHGTPEAYARVFEQFVDRIAPGGFLVACQDDPGVRTLLSTLDGRVGAPRVIRYGFAPGGSVDARTADPDAAVDRAAADATSAHPAATRTPSAGRADTEVLIERHSAAGHGTVATLSISPGGLSVTPGADRTDRTGSSGPVEVRLTLAVPGTHMLSNAAAALAAGVALGVDPEAMASGLAGYTGVRRRFEYKGRAGGVTVYDDYAHHPTEVRAQLAAARAVLDSRDDHPGRLVVVFQPHLYSRTRTFAAEFAQALATADVAVVLDVYGAREDPQPGITGELITSGIPAGTAEVHFEPSLATAPQRVAGLVREGDLLITMGAGDVTMLGPLILDRLGER
ncbi:UDP-N-acetylmuramate--L-alanine ligase [Nakamurella sp. YIM 132087]|uniref:UDP-N-acetylmuramate--L-alanine ligase n=1 Tax=Nakamurella alba TaxID=2665158 RepID=A0A7K1FR17_9ACTN|nr:UDP-N-acetylmuramate--L-alanine ligase [Nakamurella alba]MTD16510.1 UDP-N-acetylmuramate--L-alanine ligase [Nakamurella alba]